MKVKELIKYLNKYLDPEDVITFNGRSINDIDFEYEENTQYWEGDYKTGTLYCRKGSYNIVFNEFGPANFVWDCDGQVTYKGLKENSKKVEQWVKDYYKYDLEDKQEVAAYPKLDIDQLVDYLLENKEGIWWVDETRDCCSYIRKKDAGLLDKWNLYDSKENQESIGVGSVIKQGSISNYFLNTYDRDTIKQLITEFYPNRPTYINIVYYTEESPYGSKTEKLLLVDKQELLC